MCVWVCGCMCVCVCVYAHAGTKKNSRKSALKRFYKVNYMGSDF